MRIVFLGTPEFAVPSLRALADNGCGVVGVITQPDRPAGRGNKLTASPVKQLAVQRGIPVYQFERLRREDGVACLRALAPDLMITAAFGQILSAELLSIPKYGTINVHASLLPKHRGSAPINYSIINGDAVTGVSTMLTDVGVDTGDVLLRREVKIGDMETAEELTQRLSEVGAELLIETLAGYPNGPILPQKQDETQATYEPMLKKEMGLIDWSMSADRIANRVRGMNPWPCAYTDGPMGRIKIYLAKACSAEADAPAGTVVVSDAKQGLKIACGEGWLEVLEMQAPGGKRMGAKDYLRGKRIDIGTRLA